ncbi:MAG: alpha/beta hydrolase [Actinomycetota bacterium]|nr:alpha/beta hydrolase [Actinomycetota bacterium]
MSSDPVARCVAVAPGVTIPYVDRGETTRNAVVLVHGLGDSLRSHEPVLARLPDDVRALVPSLRGHGDADRPHDGYSHGDHVRDIATLLDDAGVDRAVIAGHSSGSQIAQLFAVTSPQRTHGLVLIGAPGPRPDPGGAARMTSEIAALRDPIDDAWLGELAESTVAGPVPHPFMEIVLAEARKVPARVYQAAWPHIRDFNLSPRLDRIQSPTLIVWGDQDRVPVATRHAQQQLVDAIPDARLTIYRGAGHSPHWEQPERFAADLASFVRGLPA